MPSTLSKNLLLENWGLVPYKLAFERQVQYVQDIQKGLRPQTLIFCSHPSIVTLGRGTKDGDLFAWAGETLEVNRGGRATYHGPSQVVMYPLINLDQNFNGSLKHRDIHGWIRLLENTVVETLQEYGIASQGNVEQVPLGEESQDATGVWVGSQKIASVGIAVQKWITSHGVAINIYDDPKAFVGIHPCGFQSHRMVSL